MMANEKRIVNAEAISRKLKNAYCAECNVVRKVQCSACWVEDVLEMLDGDSVDAVEVVRCKDCERRKKSADLTNSVWCMWYGTDMPKDGFCSYGERREGE